MDPMDRLLTRLRHASEASQAAKDRVIQDSGLTKAQYSALLMLDRVDRATATQLAVACEVSQQAMSQTVIRLVDGGFVAIERSPDGGRSRVLTLTNRGRASLGLADERVVALEAALRGAVPPERLDGVLDALAAIQRTAESLS